MRRWPFPMRAKAAGVQPIIGTMLGVARPDMPEGVEPPLDWLALYAQDETGYDNLCALVSTAHLDRPLELPPHVDFAALEGRTDGLIALTAGGEGALARLFAEEQPDRALRLCRPACRRCSPTGSISSSSRRARRDRGQGRGRAARSRLCPRSAARRDQPVLLCRAGFQRRARRDAVHRQFDLCRQRGSPAQLARCVDEARRATCATLFADLPEAIANTLVVAQRCAVVAPKRKPILPSLAGDREGEATQLRDDARAGLDDAARPSAASPTSDARRPMSSGSNSSSTSSSRWAFPAIS